MRRFSLYKRNGIFYCRFYNPETKKYSSGLSTGEREKNAALAQVAYWDKHGMPDRSEKSIETVLNFDTLLYYLRQTPLDEDKAETIVTILRDRSLLPSSQAIDSRAETPCLEFFKQFWDYDTSPYVKEKQAYGHSIGKRHCHEQNKRLIYWERFFDPSITLQELTRKQIKEFQLHLRKSLAQATMNVVLSAGTIPMSWATEQSILSSNPAKGLKKFSGSPKKRDILTQAEAKQLFAIPWDDERSRIGNLLAMTTGLRAGEIVALKQEDILEDRIMVRHSWSFADGLKLPKNGEERVVPLIPQVRDQLLWLWEQNPHGSECYIFYGTSHDKPMNIDVLKRGLTKAYIQIKLDNTTRYISNERKRISSEMVARGVCFHSWRHFYTTHLADRIEMRTVQLATGHKSASMAQLYAAHALDNHLDAVSQAVTDAFANVVSFQSTHHQVILSKKLDSPSKKIYLDT